MILSISRRTDIPAYYSPWILSRLEAGEVWIRNPRSPRQVSRVLFSPETVDCLVFWSKNPGPMLPYLSQLSSLGYSFYFQHTLTPYGKDIEPGLPPKRQILSFIQAFGKQLGPQRTVWRYDPVLLNQTWTIERHIQAFSQLCRALEGCVCQCVFSFLDPYPFLSKRIGGLLRPTPEQQQKIVQAFAQSAAAHGIRLTVCAEEGDFSSYGIERSACIDPKRISLLTGKPFHASKDRNQRPLCGCAPSIDLGAYDCCAHGCLYCYATHQQGQAERNLLLHDPSSPLLLGWPQPEDRITLRKA